MDPLTTGGCLTFKGRDKLNVQRVIGKRKIGSGFSPKCYFFATVNLLGLVRILKTRYMYQWEDLSLLKLLLHNLLA